ncbi:PEPxxWA-CTERM sorting domain-containing protein [uncultured Sphingomonas sp.]|uniref:PEPxxWA-CTERM sorting domain-containing protein n=1 Tax=uncultured Sphingomonas sp. TaxID=158754 RepID=UPI0026269622|nr:PEPxxWA-CTERM sorting domain-containing protein [uncultured Sphingomonas sp.]
MSYLKGAIALAALATFATSADAATKVFTYSSGGTDVATGSFSYANGATGVLGYGDLTAFSVSIANTGNTYTLADIAGLTNYVHFAYDTATNVFVADLNSCGFAGCGYHSSLSALNGNGSFGFFFNPAPGSGSDYRNGIHSFDFDTLSIKAGGVPEPASWALMILGFGAVGGMLRSAKRRSDARFDAKVKRIASGEAM